MLPPPERAPATPGDDDVGAHPVRPLVRARLLDERTGLSLTHRKPPEHRLERRVREAASRVTGVDEVAVAVVVAEEDGAEVRSRIPRLGEAANDELLSRLDLELEPRA